MIIIIVRIIVIIVVVVITKKIIINTKRDEIKRKAGVIKIIITSKLHIIGEKSSRYTKIPSRL